VTLSKPRLLPAGLFAAMLLGILLSGYLRSDPWLFFADFFPDSLRRLPRSTLFRSLLLTGLLHTLWQRPAFRSPRFFLLCFVLLALACAAALARATGFAPIHRVDHTAFLYRYHSFAATFPRPSFYDPNWNGGGPVPFLVASGLWTTGLLFLPLLKIFPVEALYTPMMALTFLLLVPLLGALSARAFGGGRRAGWIAALLFLVPSQRYFVHLLHYGTAPSLLSLALSVPVLALLWRVLRAGDNRSLIRRTLQLLPVSALMLCWPGVLVMIFPFAAALLTRIRQLTRPRLLALLLLCAALFALLLPLALAPLRYSRIGAFLIPEPPKSFAQHFLNGAELLISQLRGVHPLILFPGFLFAFLDADRARGRFFTAFLLTGLLLSGWGEELHPLLQSERVIFPVSLVAAVAAALWLDRLLDQESRNPRLAAAFCGALLLLGAHQGPRFYSGRGPATFQTMPEHTRELLDRLAVSVPEHSRILIAGRAVHGYGGAKVAAMPLWTKREMMSSDYYGFSPRLVEYQYPPRAVLDEGPDGVFRFLELYNVSHVMSYHEGWIDAFTRHPRRYRPAFQAGPVQVFEVLQPLSLFLVGEGSVKADFDRIDVALSGDFEEVILKYNWADAWRVQAPAELFPHESDFGVRLIGIRPNGMQTIHLRYRGAL